MLSPNQYLRLVVTRVEDIAVGIRLFELSDPDRWILPPFTPGAHLGINLPGGPVRHYSLCGDPEDRRSYQIAVLAVPRGRGGSMRMHTEIEAGHLLLATLPRNLFPIDPKATSNLFVAGGIGVTPFLSMILDLERRGEEYELIYCARSAESAPFLDFLTTESRSGRVRVHFDEGDPARRLDLSREVDLRRKSGRSVYFCGPPRMIEAMRAAVVDWPAARVHFEAFGPASLRRKPGDGPEARVAFARSGLEIAVGPAETLLEAVRAAGVDWPSSCEAGICGMCRAGYSDGVVDHADLCLSDDERQTEVILCVAHCKSPRLVLDL